MRAYFTGVFLFLAVFASGTAADLLTKSLAFDRLGMPGTYRPDQPELESACYVIDGVFGFQTSLNAGALFGIGQGQVAFLAALSAVFLVGIFVCVFYPARKDRFLTVSLALISAGITGNLYDRLALHGLKDWNGEAVYAVRDWILVMLGSYHYPNFNVADSLLVCGTILLMIYSLRSEKC